MGWHIAWKVVRDGLSDKSTFEQRFKQILGRSVVEQFGPGEPQVQRPWGENVLGTFRGYHGGCCQCSGDGAGGGESEVDGPPGGLGLFL